MPRVMLCLLPVLTLSLGAVACATSKSMSPDEARHQVEQLMTLYREDRTKFTLQKQHLQELKDCSEATSLRDAAKKWNDEANTQPGNSEDNFKLYSELEQAEKTCRAK